MNYADRSLYGRRSYELRNSSVFVCGTTGAGSKFEATVNYAELNPDPDKLWVRSPLLWAGVIIVAIATGSIFALSVFQAQDKEFLRAEAYVGGVVGVVLMLVSMRPIEVARFKSIAGVAVLDVFRSGPGKAKFDAFVSELKARVEAQQRPNQSPEPTAMSVTPPAAQEPRQP